MTPGRAACARTDGERPLKHSVMKRYAEISLIQRFRWIQWGAVCLIHFYNSHSVNSDFLFFFFYLWADATFRHHFDVLIKATERQKERVSLWMKMDVSSWQTNWSWVELDIREKDPCDSGQCWVYHIVWIFIQFICADQTDFWSAKTCSSGRK